FKIDVEIDAQSGTITKMGFAQGLVSQVSEVEGLLSVEEVKAIVLAKAGSSYVVVSVVLDDDDDDLDYDVVLSSLDTYIEADVDALTGEIEDWDVKRFVSNDSAQSSFNDSSSQVSFNDSSSSSSDNSSNVSMNVLISRDQAIAIARERIGESPMLIKLELDYNDGRPYYDLEFKTDDVEYEFEIDGLNGAILEFEIDDE
ncbi:MAG: PepSY domain-containing protein, partial [Erysipelotrichaceae bacterium]|nr:PepSY domain-containing protein [Erysipelotrichaceae bacterium]